MINIGDWVTQYCAGYWQVVDIKPKYADEDVNNKDFQYKKGDLISTWVLMKKAFTPKMKFRLDSDCSDGFWCKPVSPEIKRQIDQYFEEHPKDYQKFCALPCSPRPTVSSAWLNMTDEEAERFEATIKTLPEAFTPEESMRLFEANGLKHCFGKPPANYIFYCNNLPWELNENFDPIFRNPHLKKFEEK